MFNKRLLVSIILDKNKLKTDAKGSCKIECIPTINLLTKTEYKELRDCAEIIASTDLKMQEINKSISKIKDKH